MSGRSRRSGWLRVIACSPVVLVRLYRGAAASEAGDWPRAARHYGRLSERGFATDAIRLGLGTALLGLRRDAEALEQLEAIEGPLHPDDEGRWRLNRAIALSRLGRREETRRLLEQAPAGGWSDARLQKVDALLAWARGDGDRGDPGATPVH